MYSLTLPVLKGMKMDPLMGVWEPQVEIRVGERLEAERCVEKPAWEGQWKGEQPELMLKNAFRIPLQLLYQIQTFPLSPWWLSDSNAYTRSFIATLAPPPDPR